MKELTIEEKARAYDSAIERARKLEENSNGMILKKWLWNIFPELKESEDERIRGAIIHFISHTPTVPKGIINKEQMLAWLEKQKDINALIQEASEKAYTEGMRVERKRWLEKQAEVVSDKDDIEAEEKGIRKAFNKIWEEKRGEQKPIIEMKSPEESLGISSKEYNDIVNDCLYGEEKPTEKVEPKFHKGEWITNGDYTWKIIDVKPLDYILQSQDGNIVDDTISHVDEQFNLWTIQNAKDGDVLAFYSEYKGNKMVQVGIVKEYVGKHGGCSNTFSIYVGVNWENNLQIGEYMGCSDIQPATKEQCDSLMKAMTDAGYTFDFEKKELKKIEGKSAWSEEDRTMAFTLMRDIDQMSYISEEGKNKRIGWLNSLDEKFTSTESDWGEEDAVRLQRIVDFLWYNRKGDTDTIYQQEQDIDWLKSLKQRIGK